MLLPPSAQPIANKTDNFRDGENILLSLLLHPSWYSAKLLYCSKRLKKLIVSDQEGHFHSVSLWLPMPTLSHNQLLNVKSFNSIAMYSSAFPGIFLEVDDLISTPSSLPSSYSSP